MMTMLAPIADMAFRAGANGVAQANGVGRNRYTPGGFTDPNWRSGYNPGAAQWGGSPGALQKQRDYYTGQIGAADTRGAYLADYANANDARVQQDAAARMMMDRAQGNAPLISQMQAARDMGTAEQSQASAAASARGPAGLALAQQGAAANTAAAQGNISGLAQIAGAQEQLANTRAAYGAAGDMRGQDASLAQFQAQQQQQNRAANDARAMGYEQLDQGAVNAQLQAGVANQATLAQANTAREQQTGQIAQANANTDKSWWDKILG